MGVELAGQSLLSGVNRLVRGCSIFNGAAIVDPAISLNTSRAPQHQTDFHATVPNPADVYTLSAAT